MRYLQIVPRSRPSIKCILELGSMVKYLKRVSSVRLKQVFECFKGYSNECVQETEKDSLNEEVGVISDHQDNQEGKLSMTPSPKLQSSRKLLGLLTQNRSHLFLSSYPL